MTFNSEDKPTEFMEALAEGNIERVVMQIISMSHKVREIGTIDGVKMSGLDFAYKYAGSYHFEPKEGFDDCDTGYEFGQYNGFNFGVKTVLKEILHNFKYIK